MVILSRSALSVAVCSTLLVGGILNEFAIAQTLELTDTIWQLQQIQYNNDTRLEPEFPENYLIQFSEDGTVSIKADCNQVQGTYEVTGSNIVIELGPSTLAACPPDSIDDEYLQALNSSVIYFFDDGDLYFDMMADVGTLQFSAQGNPSESAAPIRGLWFR